MAGVAVGVVGLTTSSVGEYIQSLRFPELAVDADYAARLADAGAQARADGADILIAIGHLCQEALAALAPAAAELGYVALAGGHCHAPAYQRMSGVEVFSPDSSTRHYAKLEIFYAKATGTVRDTTVTLVENSRPRAGMPPAAPAAEVAAAGAEYRRRRDAILGESAGYSTTGVAAGWPWRNFVADAWLRAYPQADLAIGHWDSVPGGLAGGALDRAAIYDTMPYNNQIVLATLTGRQLIDNVSCCGPVLIAGATAEDAGDTWRVVLGDGAEVLADEHYRVATHEYWLRPVATLPPSTFATLGWTGVDWREPVVAAVGALESSPPAPLDDHIDDVARISAAR